MACAAWTAGATPACLYYSVSNMHWSLTCIGGTIAQVLAAVSSPSDWLAAAPAFNLVLGFALDSRPKVRAGPGLGRATNFVLLLLASMMGFLPA